MSDRNAEDRETVAAAIWRTHQGENGPDEDDYLIADAVLAALDVPALRAEVERLRGQVKVWMDYGVGQNKGANEYRAGRDALAAQVERVRALCDEVERRRIHTSFSDQLLCDLRAALDETGRTT